MSRWTVNISLEGTWKETFVDYFEVFSLNQSDQSVTEPISETGYLRLLSGVNANVSTESSGQLNDAERYITLGYGIETGPPAVELRDSRPVPAYCLKHAAKGKNVRLCPRNLDKYVLIYVLLMIILV